MVQCHSCPFWPPVFPPNLTRTFVFSSCCFQRTWCIETPSFHVPNLISNVHCLDRSKESAKVLGPDQHFVDHRPPENFQLKFWTSYILKCLKLWDKIMIAPKSPITATYPAHCTTSYILLFRWLVCKPGSSVSIVSGYGLDDRAIEVRSPAEAKGFFL
jgi:hypothetical protein